MPSVSSSNLDAVIVGGGIVGLATADALLRARPGLRVVVLEKEAAVAAHQTGRNSGVVHSGLYYRPGSAKARTSVLGAERMRAFCAAHGVPLRIVGKVVIATDPDETPRLDDLEQRGRANGVPDLKRIGPEELKEIEPRATGIDALHVPHAAIVDFAAVARALVESIERAGGEVRTSTKVTGFGRTADARIVRTPAGELRARALITCAGLHADRLTAAAEQRPPPARIVPFRGEYHTLRAERNDLVRGLIYPVPDPRFPFLGVHFTRTIDGGVECGPNAVLALRREGYSRTSFSLADSWATATWPGFWRLAARHWRTGAGETLRSFSRAAFARTLRRLVPDLTTQDLQRGGCGVRAQALERSGALVDDFLIVEGERSLHVVNAPSPAATAALVIGEEIAERARGLGLIPV